MPGLTDEDIALILGMGDVNSKEGEIAQQVALARSLRGAPFSAKGRNDIGSNIGRAGGGIAAGMADYRGAQGQAQLPGMRNDVLSKMAELLRRRQTPVPSITSNVPAGATEPDQDDVSGY